MIFTTTTIRGSKLNEVRDCDQESRNLDRGKQIGFGDQFWKHKY